MSGKQAVLAVLITAVSILAASAAAQDEKNEVNGIGGRTFISPQGVQGPNAPTINALVRFGNGLTFELLAQISWVPRSKPSRWKCLLFSILMRTCSPVATLFPPTTHRFLSLPRSA